MHTLNHKSLVGPITFSEVKLICRKKTKFGKVVKSLRQLAAWLAMYRYTSKYRAATNNVCK